MRYNQLSHQRILSIDAFRGITILVMIFVNELAGVHDIPQWLKHMPAKADAMSFVDVVFPAFLFIVGMSIPFAINSRLAKGDSLIQLQKHILFRTLGLLVLGFFMVNAEDGYDQNAMGMSINLWALLFFAAVILIWKVYHTSNKVLVIILRAIGFVILVALAIVYKGEDGQHITPQWWGILGLIGWAYLYSCILYQLLRGNKYLLLLMIAACIAFYAIGRLPAVRQSGMEWMSEQSGNAVQTSITLCGIVLSLIFFDIRKPELARSRFLQALLFIIILFIAGYFLRPYYKISKIYATPTWAFYSAGFCTLLFIFLYWLVEIKRIYKWTNFFRPAASNPLLTYIIPDIVYYLTALLGIILTPHFFRQGLPGMVWSALYAVAIMGIVIFLNRMKLRLHL